MRLAQRSELQVGARTIVVESGLSDDASPALITTYAENDMTTEKQRAPVVGLPGQSQARTEASLTRQISASHLGAVHELLADAVDDAQDLQTAKNLQAKGRPLEPQGILLSFCLADAPSAEAFSARGLSFAWLDTVRRADELSRATAQAYGGAPVEHVIVHGEAHAAHLLTGPRGTRACLVEGAGAPSDGAIVARLERLACAR